MTRGPLPAAADVIEIPREEVREDLHEDPEEGVVVVESVTASSGTKIETRKGEKDANENRFCGVDRGGGACEC